MKLLFRADGNNEIGWGHVMRSLSIASAAREMGSECFFVCADEFLKNKIKSFGFEAIILNSDYTKMIDELHLFEQVVKKTKPDYALIDSYYVTNEYFSEIKRYTKVVYIDDVYAFPYDVDYLVNYNIYASENTYNDLYLNLDHPRLLLGLKYVPLRSEFINMHISIKEKVENAFISTGGSDEFGLVLKIIKEIMADETLTQGKKYHFVIGSYEPDIEYIYELAKQHSWIILHENVSRMSELMRSCDVAVSAAGSTLYELCACGIPTVTYILADNQIDGANEFERQGLMCNAGDLRINNYDCSNLVVLLKELMSDYTTREKMHNKVISLIDGNGAYNIINELRGK